MGVKKGSHDGRNKAQRDAEVKLGMPYLGNTPTTPPTFTTGFSHGETYGEWVWDDNIRRWVYADDWEAVQRELAQKKISKKK